MYRYLQRNDGVFVAGRPSQEADEALALLDLLLHFVAGRGDFGLRREDGAQEGEGRAAGGRVEGPAHGAQAGPVRRRLRAAVQAGLVRAPAGRVQHQAQDQEQA